MDVQPEPGGWPCPACGTTVLWELVSCPTCGAAFLSGDDLAAGTTASAGRHRPGATERVLALPRGGRLVLALLVGLLVAVVVPLLLSLL